jgi:protein-disulfide isomerase
MKSIFNFLSTIFITIFLYTPTNAKTVLDITENDFVIGDLNAPVTMIEYASLSCGHCADFHNNKLGDLKTEYV